jgi:hypothetical protein
MVSYSEAEVEVGRLREFVFTLAARRVPDCDTCDYADDLGDLIIAARRFLADGELAEEEE